MKKIIILSITLTIAYFSNAQSYEKGNILINAGFGFGVQTGSLSAGDESGTTGALPGLTNVTGEYAISDKFGAEVRYERNGYVVGNEEDDLSKVTSHNIMFGPSFHFANGEKTSWYTNLLIGSSSIKFTGSNNDFYVVGRGMVVQLNIGGNLYFSDNIGMFFETGYASHNYSSLTSFDEDADPKETTWKENDKNVTFILSGMSFRTGLALKF